MHKKNWTSLQKNTNLLDLGSSPGGWSQVASKLITSGKVLSIDIKQMKPIDNVKFLHCNFFESSTKDKIKNYIKGKLDVVISDMAADTTGNKSLDSIRTNQLCAEAINFSSKILKKDGIRHEEKLIKELENKNFKVQRLKGKQDKSDYEECIKAINQGN